MNKIEQLKSDIDKIEKGLKSPTTPEQFKDGLRKIVKEKKDEIESLMKAEKKEPKKEDVKKQEVKKVEPVKKEVTESKLSDTERKRLDILQSKEDNDNLTKSENKEYEDLVAKYRKTDAYKKVQSDRAEKKSSGKSSQQILDDCRKILSRHNKQKKSAVQRIKERKKQGKPATLTPSETVSKTAKSIKSKVIEMKDKTDKGLPVSEVNKLSSGIVATVKSTLSGIKNNVEKQKFITHLISEIRSLGSGLTKVAMQGGLFEDGGMFADGGYNDDREKYVKLLNEYDKIGAFLDDAETKEEKDKYRKQLYEIESKINRYERSGTFADGGMFEQGGRYNTGRSWTLDHNQHNKSESYEVSKSNRKYEGGGGIDLLADMSGAELHNVGGTSFSNADLTPHMDIANPMFEDGGYMADGMFGKGGGISSVKMSKFYTNIMGTLSFDMKLENMRKEQDFSVYPISKGDTQIMIQSDTRIGLIDMASGKGRMSQSHPNGAYGVHLQMDNLVPFQLEPNQLSELKYALSQTAGKNVGRSVVKSDNEGAGDFMEKGGRYNTGRSWTLDRNQHNKSESYELPESDRKFGAGGMNMEEYLEKKKYSYEEGGDIADSNTEMLMSKIRELQHHTSEIQKLVNSNTKVEAWVVAKAERSATDLSDITHYIDGKKSIDENKFADGGRLASVEVMFENPEYNYSTSVNPNATEQEIRKYFVGNMFDMGVYPSENFQKVIDIKYNKNNNYAHGGLTEHGLQIGDKIIDETSFSENGISVMNDGRYAMVDLDKGERIEGIYADGGIMLKGGNVKITSYKDYKQALTNIANETNSKSEFFDMVKSKLQQYIPKYFADVRRDIFKINDSDWVKMIQSPSSYSSEIESVSLENVYDKLKSNSSTKAKAGNKSKEDKRMLRAKSYWNTFDKKQRIGYLIGAMYSQSVANNLSEKSWENLDEEVHNRLRNLLFADGGTLNYVTNNGINFDIVHNGKTAIVIAKIEDEDNYMLDKSDLREMSESARTKGIDRVELHTNYGLELRSNENPKIVGFDSIKKKSFADGGIINYKKIKRIGEDEKYGFKYIVREEGDNYVIVEDEKIELWENSSPMNRKMYYEDLLPKEEVDNEFIHFADGGGVDEQEDMEVQFIDYKDTMIMYEPHYKEYYTNDIKFDSLEKAKKYIDDGSKMTPAQINAYRRGAMADGGIVELKGILKQDYQKFVELLGENIKDKKFRNTVKKLAKENKVKFKTIDVPCEKLQPTQSEISLTKSLLFPLTSPYYADLYLKAESPIRIKNNTILTCDNGRYIIDGHHRWSQVFVLNPKALMGCTDFYQLNKPIEGLKATQLGIATDIGYVPTQTVNDTNMLTVSENTLKKYVSDNITKEVREVFLNNGIDNPEEHIWKNVRLLKTKNKPIKGASKRDFMPQTDVAKNFAKYTPNLSKLADGGITASDGNTINVGDLVTVNSKRGKQYRVKEINGKENIKVVYHDGSEYVTTISDLKKFVFALSKMSKGGTTTSNNKAKAIAQKILNKKMSKGGRTETQENNFGVSYKIGDEFTLGSNLSSRPNIEVYIVEILPSGLFFKVDKSTKVFSIKTLNSKGSTLTSGEYLIPKKKS
jgi:hypothetical protein